MAKSQRARFKKPQQVVSSKKQQQQASSDTEDTESELSDREQEIQSATNQYEEDNYQPENTLSNYPIPSSCNLSPVEDLLPPNTQGPIMQTQPPEIFYGTQSRHSTSLVCSL